MIKQQFTLYLENKPGALAAVTKRLYDAGVNIEGISISETTDVGLVQMVVSNTAATKKALNKTRVPFTVQDVARLHIRNEPGALYQVVAKLAKKGVNINYVYSTGSDCGGDCLCYAIISAPNLKKVEEAWKSAN